MKILHVLSSLQTGGIEKLIVDLAKVSNNDNNNSFSVVIINKEYRKEMIDRLNDLKVNLYLLDRIPKRSWTIFFASFRFRKLLRNIKPDIIHVHNQLSFVVTWFASLGLAGKKIYTLHNTRLYGSRLTDLFVKRIALSSIHRFIAISDAAKSDFFNGKKYFEKTDIIYNGIDIKEFQGGRTAETPKVVLICVARLRHSQKGQDLLIKAVSVLKQRGLDVECLLVGEGDSRALLKGMIDKHDLSDQIHLMGNRDDVPELMWNSDIFVLPSRYEGLGIVLLEAMAAGLPIVASNVDGVKELIEDGVTGLLFEPLNTKDMADKIEMFIQDASLRQICSENGLVYVKKFSIEKMYKNYLNTYESALR